MTAGSGCVDLTRPTVLDGRDGSAMSDTTTSRGGSGGVAAGGSGGATDGPDPIDVPGSGGAVDDDASMGSDTGDAGQAGDAGEVGLAAGKGCATDGECGSGFCVDQICCVTPCAGECHACNVPGSEGTCTPIAAGEDPADECAMEPAATCGHDGTCDGAGACERYKVGTQCQPGSCNGSTETPASTCDATGACMGAAARACTGGSVCQGTSCATSCAADAACQIGFFCESGACRSKRVAGAACTATSQCASGYCVDGVCCGTPCTELCSVCNLAGSAGTCKPVPAGLDPRNVCATDSANVCGNDGTCNGAGVCRRPTGTSCGVASCTGAVAVPTGMCNGAGTCLSQVSRDCGAYQCAGAACGTSCTNDNACTVGYSCVGNACVALPGPVMYWKFDETSGITAFDASGNGINGAYEGSGTAIPASSPLLPPLLFPNAASRAFTRSQRHAVQVANMDSHPLLKPTLDVTMSIWYRSGSVASGGGEELFSAGDSYGMRVWAGIPKIGGNPPGFEVSKNTTSGHSQCFFATPKALDGGWHHVAGVITGATMQLFVDGVPGTACSLAMPIKFLTENPDFWVGRHGNGTSSSWDFEGNMDEVRVYNRPLSAAEIARLASGRP
jgi:hypothetical protein